METNPNDYDRRVSSTQQTSPVIRNRPADVQKEQIRIQTHAPRNVASVSQPPREQPVSTSIELEAELTLDQLLALIAQMKDVDPDDELYQETENLEVKRPLKTYTKSPMQLKQEL